MTNKDKRSLVLMLVLGDGSIGSYSGGGNKKYGRITIDHGLEQADYQSWKAKLLSEIFQKDVKMRTGHKGKSVQVCTTNTRIKAWRKFCYPNNKKDLAKILPFIRHPEMAAAVWLMDDGYVENSPNKKYPNAVSARFRIFTCDQTEETQTKIIEWFNRNFGINTKVNYCFNRKYNKNYPFIKFGQADSLIVWEKIREFVLQFKSMQHKFRYIEQVYQNKLSQRTQVVNTT